MMTRKIYWISWTNARARAQWSRNCGCANCTTNVRWTRNLLLTLNAEMRINSVAEAVVFVAVAVANSD